MKSSTKGIISLISIIVILVAVSFLFHDDIKGILNDNKVVIVVNNDKITRKEYVLRYNVLKENAIQFSNRKDILDQIINGKTYRELLKEKVFNVLIDETVCLQNAKKLNIDLTEQEKKEIKNYIESIKKDSSMSKYFNEYMRKIGSDESHFYNDLYNTRVINKLYAFVTKNVVAEEKEVQKYYNDNKDEFKKVKILDIFFKVNGEQDDNEKKKNSRKCLEGDKIW